MRVMVAIPAYTGTIHLGTMRSLFADLQALAARDQAQRRAEDAEFAAGLLQRDLADAQVLRSS